MKHIMKLQTEPFNMISSGQKTIELRLYDEKRQKVKLNDEIEFHCLNKDVKPITVRVKALYHFSDFEELYEALPLLRCGYTKETLSTASPKDMEQYYSREDQQRYGVVGIEIQPYQLQDDSLLSASRFLCLVLRHKPEAAGISVDSHGWAKVDELLQGIDSRHPLTMEQLEEIVRTDDKQRYSFNSDKTMIRCNQGHSINVDVGLTECQPPEYLFHGTGEKYVQSILKDGLVSKTRLFVHLSENTETAKAVGLRHGLPVVFTVLSGQMFRDGIRFFKSDNGVWLTEYVSPVYLEQLSYDVP